MHTKSINASTRALYEAADLQLSKGADYQSALSSVRQGDYYPRGLLTILDIIRTKELRARSLTEKYAAGGDAPNHESIRDSLIDLINYASFGIAWLEGGIDGQSGRDLVGRPPRPDVARDVVPEHDEFE